MAGTTSLLRSAAATRKRVQQQEDALVTFDWQNSAQTYEQFQEYSRYLQDRQSGSTDPSQKLTYARNIVSARRSYTSNELQRQQMAIMEGRGTTTDKLNKVFSLYEQAVDNGDYNLAQNLATQYDNLSIKLQNEAESAQRAAGSMAINGVKTLNALVKKLVDGEEGVELADGTLVKPIASLNNELTGAGEASVDYFGQVADTVKAIQALIVDAYNGAQTQEAVDKIEEKFGDYFTGEKKFKTAAGNLTAQDIELAYKSAQANNPIYSPVSERDPTTGALKYSLKKNKIDDLTWIRNDDGTYQAIEVRAKVPSEFQKLDSKITNEGYFLGDSDKNGVSNIGSGEQVQTNSAETIGDRLRRQNIIATQNEDGTLDIILPTGEQVKGTIMPDGSIRYFGVPGRYSGSQAGLYEINIFNGDTREVAPDESSIFGEASSFGGQLSQASTEGKRITAALAGNTTAPTDLLSASARINNPGANDFTGMGSPVLQRNLQGASSSVLQRAAEVRLGLQAEQKAAERAKIVASERSQRILQPSNVFNLNQTPVQQFAQNGAPIRQLRVSRPLPVTPVRVSAPSPTPRISGVTVAQPTQRISGVAPLPAMPTLRVY